MSESNTTRRAAVATPHPEAAAAAMDVLARGGNAVDAAAAAVLTCCVVMPGSVGFGGYGGCMVAHLAGRGVVAVDFDSRAPLAYRDELYAGKPGADKRGYLAVSVPAVVAGIDLAVREFGKLTFRDAAVRALALAEGGFPMVAAQHKLLLAWKARADAASLNAFFPGGQIPAVGERWVQADLARLIRRLCDEGPAAMYQGEIPRQIVRQVHDHGGILAEEDFTGYKAAVVEPNTVTYRGHELFTPAPPSGGLTSLQTLKALERFDVRSMEPWGAPFLHTLAEVTKACWHDRERYLGDPDVVKIPVADLLSDRRAAEIAAAVTDRASTPPAPTGTSAGGEHTVNVVTADRDGNVVSLTATQGEMFGSDVVIQGLGLVMGHGMSRFDRAPAGNPNSPAPGKRMHHNMSPLIVLRDGRPRFVVGMPGGQKIPNVTAQIALNLIDFGYSPAVALRSTKLHTDGAEPLQISRADDKVVKELERMGHTIKRVPGLGGPANAVAIDPLSGHPTAASEAGEKSVGGT